MARLTTEYKRAFLRSLALDGQDTGEGLLVTIQNTMRARIDDTTRGKVLISTSQNGKTATYQVPPGLSPHEITGLCDELFTLYGQASGYITSRGGTATDTTILTEMLALLQPVYWATADFSGLTR